MSNQLLLYVTKMSIDKFKKEFGNMEEIHLYKTLFLIEQELLKSGIDIQLPYVWYQKGPMVQMSGFVSQTGFSFEIFSPNMYSKGIYPKHVVVPNIEIEEPENKNVIDKAIDLRIDGIKKASDVTNYLIAEAYKYAPYDFQRNFKKFEKFIDDGNYAAAKELFDSLVIEFPEKNYPAMTNLFLEWEIIVDLSFEMQKYSAIEDINKPFWRAFCLKLSQKENKNLSNKLLGSLIEQSEHEYLNEEKNVFDISSKFYRDLEKSDFSDQTLRDMNYLNQLILDEYSKD